MENWEDRSKIVANLLNPAFCGEILRRAIVSYNDNEEDMLFPFSLLYLILPIILHKKTRDNMPQRSSTYFYHWVNENEYLFIDFAGRVKELLPYTKESLMFLLLHNAVEISDNGEVQVNKYSKKLPVGENVEEN